MIHRYGIAVLLIAGATALGSPRARAVITVADDFPRRGDPVLISVTGADGAPAAEAMMRVVYRPGSEVSREERLGPAGDAGTVLWTPTEAGVVTLTAELPDGSSESRNLSVLYRGVPAAGLVVLLFAGFILYGGVIHGFSHLRRLPADLPPDT